MITIFIIQLLNSFFYAAVLFLIAAGRSSSMASCVSLEFRPWDALCARCLRLGLGRRRGGRPYSERLARPPAPAAVGAIAVVGAVIEPTLLRPLYRRPEEYHLLITFGLLMILEDAMKFLFGGTFTDRRIDHEPRGQHPDRPAALLSDLQPVRHRRSRWFIYRTKFGVILRATSAGSAHGRSARDQCQPCLRASLRHRLLMHQVWAARSWCRRRPPCSAWALRP